MAAFNVNPGIGKKNLKPAMTPISELQPQLEMANQGKQAKVIQSNANANKQTYTKPSGKRIGGKVKRDNKTKEPNKYITMVNRNKGGGSNKSDLTVTAGDFGFNIDGSSQATSYEGKRDQTLFRDYNQQSTIATSTTQTIATNSISNSLKLLDINLEQSLISGYNQAWTVIKNCITRDIVSNTRAAKGAMDLLNEITVYLSDVSHAFDLLIELEVMQAWSPSTNDYYDRSMRAIASGTSTPEILELRAKLRQALIPHVLPHDWMMYIKWLRETKLQNSTPESTKLRFISSVGASLIDDTFRGNTPTDWTSQVNSTISDLENLNPAIAATLINNVDCVNLKNVKDYYTGVHNSASFDPNYNDIFNNRVIVWEISGNVQQYPKTNGTQCYAAFHTDTPYSMALASLNRQEAGFGVPLEGKVGYVKVGGQGIAHNNFQMTETVQSTGSVFAITGPEDWWKYHDDSAHVVDIAASGALTTGMSTPKGTDVIAFFAGTSNMDMAARESLSALTLVRY